MPVQSGRWAVILKENADGKSEVTDIKLMEGVPPEINVDAVERYELEEVEAGVMIGMVRGGPVKSVGGFGFPEGADLGGRFGPGVTRMADTRATVDETALPPVSHEKQRGTAAPDNGGESQPSQARSETDSSAGHTDTGTAATR